MVKRAAAELVALRHAGAALYEQTHGARGRKLLAAVAHGLHERRAALKVRLVDARAAALELAVEQQREDALAAQHRRHARVVQLRADGARGRRFWSYRKIIGCPADLYYEYKGDRPE